MTKNNMANDSNDDEELVMMEMRMTISYTLNSNALLFTTSILNGQLM